MDFLYITLSTAVLFILYPIIKKLANSNDNYSQFAAIAVASISPLFHFYVSNFDVIPIFKIDISNNEFLQYTSLFFGYLSSAPYIIARRKIGV